MGDPALRKLSWQNKPLQPPSYFPDQPAGDSQRPVPDNIYKVTMKMVKLKTC